MSLDHLAIEWREKATVFRDHAEEPLARAYDLCAEELDNSLAQVEEETLTLRQASAETGYSQRHLGQLMKDGTIPNSGTAESPRLIRSHLPRKPGHGIAQHGPEAASSITQVARAIATRGEDNGSA